MGRFLSKAFQGKDGYHLGERPGSERVIKLNANESPFAPSPKVLASVTERLLTEQNVYADPKSTELTAAFADFCGVRQDEVYADSGSDVILSYMFTAFGRESGFCFPDVTYNFYHTFCDFFGIPYREIPLREDFSIRAEDYCACGRNVLLANPNAPSGLKLSLEEIEQIVSANRSHLVVIDEAYVDFGNESCIPLIRDYDNLLVIQTASKSRSLAGARIGLAVSRRENIEDLEMMKAAFNPDSINSVSQAMGCAAVKDVAYMRAGAEKIAATREWVRKALLERGFTVTKSSTNFLFFRPPYLSAEQLYLALKERGILVRYYDQPRVRDYIRMSVGTDEQMRTVLSAIDGLLREFSAAVS